MLSPVASGIIVTSYIVAMLLMLALLGGLVFVLLRLEKLLNETVTKVDPLMEQVGVLLVKVNDLTETAGSKTEAILADVESATETVSDRVERTAAVVAQTVAKPVTGVNALVAGVASGAATFAALQNRDRNRRQGSTGIRNGSAMSGVELSGSTFDSVESAVSSESLVSKSSSSEPVLLATAGAPGGQGD